MKKLTCYAGLMIAALLAAGGCAGARGYVDQGLPENLPVLGAARDSRAEAAPRPADASGLSVILSRQTEALSDLAASINRLLGEKTIVGEKTPYRAGPAPTAEKEPQIGRPETGAFSRYAAGAAPEERKRTDPDKLPAMRRLPDPAPAHGAKETAEMKDRLSRLEEILDFHHPGFDAGSVFFAPAGADLSPAAKGWLDEKIRRWFAGEIDILAVNGYASPSRPRHPGVTNIDYARQRAEAALAYLEIRGVKTDCIQINIRGETSRFTNNKNVTLVWEEVKDEMGKKYRKEERKK